VNKPKKVRTVALDIYHIAETSADQLSFGTHETMNISNPVHLPKASPASETSPAGLMSDRK
jgi:hypothetical protein